MSENLQFCCGKKKDIFFALFALLSYHLFCLPAIPSYLFTPSLHSLSLHFIRSSSTSFLPSINFGLQVMFYSNDHLSFLRQEHGRCAALDECTCDYGWTGASCALPDCAAVNQCSKKGECISSNKCRCFPGFAGADCGQVTDCSHLANCTGQGVCISTAELLNVSCR